ncbi:MAG: bile acid:sodium symporter family protein [Rhodoferax sp.]|uniref:bile acid:sodium symporter family protein n=1 Tax=Rhodoferax sp. TaxID=50421 RepID=UPI0030161E1A
MTLPTVSQLLPLALAFIMLYLGMTLQLNDFKRVLLRPRALLAGLIGQLIMVPLLGLGVAWSLQLDPVMAVGLMVLAACPGGVSSGLLTHLARGDVALSISLTAVTSVAAVLTLPLVVDASMRLFMASGMGVEFPLGSMVRSIFLLTTVPVLTGMALRAWQPGRVARLETLAGRLATALFVLIVFSTFWDQRQVLMDYLPSVGPASLLLNGLILTGAWVLSRQFKLSGRDRIAVVTECGLQNSALGIFVCVQLLHSPAMSVPSVVYALLMNGGALIFVLLMRAPFGVRGFNTPPARS